MQINTSLYTCIQTDRIAHTTALLYELSNNEGSQWGIDPTTHSTMLLHWAIPRLTDEDRTQSDSASDGHEASTQHIIESVAKNVSRSS